MGHIEISLNLITAKTTMRVMSMITPGDVTRLFREQGLLWLMLYQITSGGKSLQRGVFLPLSLIIKWVRNGHNVSRRSESGASWA